MKPDYRNLPDGYRLAVDAFAAGARPPPDWTVSQWADERRRLVPETSKEHGRWHTDRVPLAREIMDALSPNHPAHRVIFMASRQVSKTEIGLNWMGYHADLGKGPFMHTQPNLEPLAERVSKTRVQPLLENTPTLAEKFSGKSRDGNNTIYLKKGPGVVLCISGANSSASIRQLPVKYFHGDEIDEYLIDLEGQGDPVAIIEGAMTTFPDRKVYLCSSPTIKSLSRIDREYEASDKRRYHVPCPHCHAAGRPDHGLQTLVLEQVAPSELYPHEAAYLCIHCGKFIEEEHKTWMFAEEGYGGFAKWIPERPERTAAGILGYHANGFYASPGLGYTWGELYRMYEHAKKDPVALKTFVNIRLGLCSEDPEEKLDHEELMSRVGGWPVRTVPAGCLAITGGVDIHKTHFRALKLGHGRNNAVYFLDYITLAGDPTDPVAWQAVENWMAEPLYTAGGIPMKVMNYGVDAGYLIEEVLNFTTPRKWDGVFAVKGASNPGRPIIARGPGKVEFSWPKGSPIRHGGEVWTVGGDTATEQLYLRIKTDKDKPADKRMVNFPGFPDPDHIGQYRDALDETFYLELTAEIFDPRKGRYERVRDNHAHDCYRYAMAAARHPSVALHHWSEAKWRAQEDRYFPPRDLFSSLDETAAPGASNEAGQPDLAPAAATPKTPDLSMSDIIRARLTGR